MKFTIPVLAVVALVINFAAGQGDSPETPLKPPPNEDIEVPVILVDDLNDGDDSKENNSNELLPKEPVTPVILVDDLSEEGDSKEDDSKEDDSEEDDTDERPPREPEVPVILVDDLNDGDDSKEDNSDERPPNEPENPVIFVDDLSEEDDSDERPPKEPENPVIFVNNLNEEDDSSERPPRNENPVIFVNNDDDGETDEMIDVAVIGGGLAGIYSAWRLVTANESINPLMSAHANMDFSFNEDGSATSGITVSLFELSDRIGGRLLSISPPNVTEEVKAEFGHMHFDPSQPLSEVIFEYPHLDVSTKPSPSSDDSNINYFRGKRVRESNLNVSDLPYELNWVEEGKHPREILHDAIETVVPGASSFNHSEWQDAKKHHKFDGEYLYNHGLWNVLSKVLSHEAFKLIHAYFGTDATLGNCNAAEGIHNLCKYYATKRELVTPEMGMEMIPHMLGEKFVKAGGKLHFHHRMIEFHRVISSHNDNEKNETFFNETINATEAVVDGGEDERFLNDAQNSNVTSPIVDTEPYYLIHFEGKPSVKARHIILALPRRSLELINQTNDFFQNETVRSLIPTITPIRSSKLYMCYDEPWWTKSPGVRIGRSVTDLPLRQIYYFFNSSCMMSSLSDGRDSHYWEELQPSYNKTRILNFEEHIVKDEHDDAYRWGYLQASSRMIKYAQDQLKEVHHLKHIDEPSSASYLSWNREPFGGLGHAWNVGVMPWKVQKSMMKPLSDWSVYIVGEAYSSEQNMIEGDFSSSETMLQEHFFAKDVKGHYYRHGPDMRVRGMTGGDDFGSKVSTSADGKRVAVASGISQEDGTVTRHVSVYEYFGTKEIGFWHQIGFDIGSHTFVDDVDSDSVYSVSLSADGNCLAVGAVGIVGNNTHIEHVQVFTDKIDGLWVQVGENITDGMKDLLVTNSYNESDVNSTELDANSTELNANSTEMEHPGNWFGSSVSLSEDGNTLAVGAPQYANGTGAAFLLKYSADGWVQYGDVIDGNTQAAGHFGFSVSLSRNGTVVAVGAPNAVDDNTTSGFVSVFSLENDEGWSKQGSDIYGLEANDRFGHAVSLSEDGARVAVGAPHADGFNSTLKGYGIVYENVGGNWADVGDAIYGTENGDNAGYSVSLAHKGNVLYMGSPGIDMYANDTSTSVGHVVAYKLIREMKFSIYEMSWMQVGLSFTGSSVGDRVGMSVSASSDGDCVAIGAPTGDFDTRGSVRVWRFEPFGEVDPFDMISDQTLTAKMSRFHNSTYDGHAEGEIKMVLYDTGDIDIKLGIFGTSPGCSTDNTNINGCGVHIYSGSSCDDEDLVGGHHYDSSVLAHNPWAEIRYSSHERGGLDASTSKISMVGGNGYDVLKNIGHAVVIHDTDGSRIACGILGEEVHKAEMSLYPGSGYPNNPEGDVKLVFGVSGDIDIMLDVIRLPGCSTDNTNTNGCGVHIHSGTSCDDRNLVGDHYYENSAFADDPWEEIKYNRTNVRDISLYHTPMVGGNGYDARTNQGHAVVIHNPGGGPIACGILGQETLTAEMSLYPDSTFDGNPEGKVKMVFGIGDGMDIMLDVTGVSPECSDLNTDTNGCGVHIHSGTSCEDVDSVGGHYYDDTEFTFDPWEEIRYSSTNEDDNNLSTSKISMINGNGFDVRFNNGHAVVIHDAAGGRIACGILGQETLKAEMNSYPGSDFNELLEGEVKMIFGPNGSIDIMLEVIGADCLDSDSNTDGCGVRLHSGSSCEDVDSVGDHYYDSSVFVDNPWANITYSSSTDEEGKYLSTSKISMTDGNGYSVRFNRGRAVVMEDNDGNRIACGVLG